MKKNLITTKDFISKSIGEWKSLRSTHSLAFQEFENTNSKLLISYLSVESKEILEITKEFQYPYILSFAIRISWESISDWPNDNYPQKSETILIFSPKDEFSGAILKSKGYTELIPTLSNYYIDEKENLNINSTYNSTISQEKICFLSQNVRSRFSVTKNKNNNGILQTSYATEIRRLTT